MSQMFHSLIAPVMALQGLPELFGVSPGAFSASALFSGMGAFILGKFTAQIGWITGPVNFLGLLIASVFANWLFAGIEMPIHDPDFQAPLIYSLAGMSLAGLGLVLLQQEE